TGEVEIQEKDKEQTNVQTSGFISLLDILHPLLNNKIYDSIMAYYHEDCRTESLSKIAQDTKSIEYIIGNLNGSILDGHILNIRFKMLIECLVGNPTDLYFGDKNEDNKFSVNCDKWEINWSTAGEIEIWFLNNDESRIIRVQDFIHSARMRHTLFKNNDILFVSHCSSLKIDKIDATLKKLLKRIKKSQSRPIFGGRLRRSRFNRIKKLRDE
ncbi:9181_t:CDS:2, partial [Rhizophagus irregularis]